MFLEDTYPIFKLFMDLLNEKSGFSAPVFSNLSNLLEFRYVGLSKKIMFQKELDFVELFGVSWCLQK